MLIQRIQKEEEYMFPSGVARRHCFGLEAGNEWSPINEQRLRHNAIWNIARTENVAASWRHKEVSWVKVVQKLVQYKRSNYFLCHRRTYISWFLQCQYSFWHLPQITRARPVLQLHLVTRSRRSFLHGLCACIPIAPAFVLNKKSTASTANHGLATLLWNSQAPQTDSAGII